ncbi:type A2 lantipeptide [Streptomyces albus subsp. chlorinus]|uniref:type A2 lantipeptide n=1 Tax=Streptomyces albus TaxID=1888 RepID=UPI00156DAC83|nr:type A2 lantipeptide [Streptomyces albus]NSC21400.1 type A2 lantipeptide [Streptomyces albus subsp. chlorinus]
MRHHIETAELADAELDAVSGGIASEALGAATSTVDGVEGLVGNTVNGVSTDGLPGVSVALGAQS